MKNIQQAQIAASSPAARAKAVATMKRRREEKEMEAMKRGAGLAPFNKEEVTHIPLDAIPDREPKRKYTRKAPPREIVGNADARVALALELAKMFNKLIGETK